jgi:hypothetical protein
VAAAPNTITELNASQGTAVMNWIQIADCAVSIFIIGSIAVAAWSFVKYLRS